MSSLKTLEGKTEITPEILGNILYVFCSKHSFLLTDDILKNDTFSEFFRPRNEHYDKNVLRFEMRIFAMWSVQELLPILPIRDPHISIARMYELYLSEMNKQDSSDVKATNDLILERNKMYSEGWKEKEIGWIIHMNVLRTSGVPGAALTNLAFNTVGMNFIKILLYFIRQYEVVEENKFPAIDQRGLAGPLMEEGDNDFKNQDYDKAISMYTNAIEIDPGNEKIYFNRGLTYEKDNNYGRAITDYNHAIKINPKYCLAYISRAISYNFQKKYDKAIDDFSFAIEMDPNDASTYLRRAVAFWYMKNYEKASCDVQKAQSLGLEVDPEFLEGLREVSKNVPTAGELEKDGSSKEKAVVITAKNEKEGVEIEYEYINNILGQLGISVKEKSQECQVGADASGKVYDIIRVTFTNGVLREFFFDITSFFGKTEISGFDTEIVGFDDEDETAQKNHTKTIVYNNESMRSFPRKIEPNGPEDSRHINSDDAVAHYNQGASYGKAGHYQEAVKEFRQAILMKPAFAEAYGGLGGSYGSLGHYEESIEALKKAIHIKPDFFEALIVLSDSYIKMDRYQEAVETLRQAILIKPDETNVYFGLGMTYVKMDRYQDAIKAYKQAIRIKPDYADAHYRLGGVYSKLGRYQEAVEAYKQVICLTPDDADAHYNLGLAYLTCGDNDSVLEQHKILKDLDGDLANKLFNLIYQ